LLHEKEALLNLKKRIERRIEAIDRLIEERG